MHKCRAGQWARKLCLLESLQAGSILPYLARAKDEVAYRSDPSFGLRLPRLTFIHLWAGGDHF